MEIPKSFRLDMRGFSMFSREERSLRRHDVISKGVTKPMRWCLNMSFLAYSKESVKLLMSHETNSTSQFESHREVRILIVIVDGTESKR